MTPLPVRIPSVVLFLFGLLAFSGSLFMWGEGFLFSFPSGMDYRLPVTDVLVNAPASILAAIGLWGMKRWGYAVSQFVAGFYVYASVEFFVDVIQSGSPCPVEIVIPQVMAVAVAAIPVLHLWRIRDLFRQVQAPDATCAAIGVPEAHRGSGNPSGLCAASVIRCPSSSTKLFPVRPRAAGAPCVEGVL